MSPAAERVAEVVARFYAELLRLGAEVLPFIERIGRALESELLEILATLQGRVTRPVVREVETRIEQALERARFRAYAASGVVLPLVEWARQRQESILAVAAGTAVASVGLPSPAEAVAPELAPEIIAEILPQDPTDAAFQALTDRRAREVFAMTQRAAQESEILRTTEVYRRIWAESFDDNWERAGLRLGETFARAERDGLTVEEVAQELLGHGTGDLRVVARVRDGQIEYADPGSRFSIRGHMSPEAWARGFTRAKFTEISTRLAVREGIASGLSDFVNIGIPDDRQSDECYHASNAGALSLDAWLETWFGLPPRHVLNCRCGVVAVGASMRGYDWSQPNPFVEERLREAA